MNQPLVHCQSDSKTRTLYFERFIGSLVSDNEHYNRERKMIPCVHASHWFPISMSTPPISYIKRREFISYREWGCIKIIYYYYLLCSPIPLVPCLYVHWSCWFPVYVHLSHWFPVSMFIGSLSLCSPVSLVPCLYVRWSHWFPVSMFTGPIGSLSLC